MSKNKLKVLAVVIILTNLLTGCWDTSNIEDKNIVTMFIVDYEDGKYVFYDEIANINGTSGSGDSKTPVYSILRAEGKTFIEARDDLNRRCDNEIFNGATRAVVFTKIMAQKGIEEYLNRMRGNADYRKTLDLVTTSTSAEKVIKDKPENSASLGDAIENTLKEQNTLGNSFHVSAGDILQVISDKKAGFLLPEINLVDEENTLTGYSVFKDAKYIGLIPADQRKGVVYLMAPKSKFYYEVNYKGRKIQIMCRIKSKKINPQFDKKQLTFKIGMVFDAQICYMDELVQFDENDKEEMSKKLKELIKKDIADALYVSQKEYRCDYLLFYKYFRAYNQSKFKTVDWEEMYANAFMDLSVKVTISSAEALDISPK